MCRASLGVFLAMPSEPQVETFLSGPAEAGRRLDLVLTDRLPELSRARVQQLIHLGLVTVGGLPAKAGHRLRPGEEVTVIIPPPRPPRAEPEAIPLPVVYQDLDLLVVNKPRGMVTHPAAGSPSGTLVNALLGLGASLAPGPDSLRPGIVHRLDKDTSGLLVVARSELAHRHLSRQIQGRTLRRLYLALVHGSPAGEAGTIVAPIGRHPVQRKRMAVTPRGRPAVTHWRVRERFTRYTLLEVQLETGRTHQIRVHFRHVGHPVVGDPVYGRSQERLPVPLAGQALHAWKLTFQHPRTGATLDFCAPLPPDFGALLETLRAV